MTTGWQEWTADDAAGWIAAPAAGDDKYSRGVLGVVTGSQEFPGAAVLGVEAAHRTGVGMVRYIGTAVGAAGRAGTPPGDRRRRRSACRPGSSARASTRRGAPSCCSATSGTRSPPRCPSCSTPARSTSSARTPRPPSSRRTPASSRGLLTAREVPATVEEIRAAPGEWAERAAAELGVAVLLKGAVTHVCDPDGDRYTVTAPTHWLATAGSGDVLGGILGALVATHHARLATDAEVLTALAATAAWVHGEAARRASADVGGGPITALDIAEAVPAVIGALLAR